MTNIVRTAALVAILTGATLACSGCAYMADRGNDALDILDIGVTFTKTPHVAVYAGFQSLLSFGYADIDDGRMFGIGQRHCGWLPLRYNAGGALLEGTEQWGFDGNFDPNDPNSPPVRGAGIGLLYHETPRTAPQFLQCPKFVHLGWIGINLNCKIGAVVQFLGGWFGTNLGHSDGTWSDRAVCEPIVERRAAPAAGAP